MTTTTKIDIVILILGSLYLDLRLNCLGGDTILNIYDCNKIATNIKIIINIGRYRQIHYQVWRYSYNLVRDQ